MSAPDKWNYYPPYQPPKRKGTYYYTATSDFFQPTIYPPLRNKVAIWDKPRPGVVYKRKNLDYLYPSVFFGSYNPLATTAWKPSLPAVVLKKKSRHYMLPSLFFVSYKSIKTVPFLIGLASPTAVNIPQLYAMSTAKRPKFVWHSLPSFFMNIKTIPSRESVWTSTREVDNTWTKVAEMP
jgi:hypothetical protein